MSLNTKSIQQRRRISAREPSCSVVDKPSLTETAGLNTYNFLDVGQELSAYNDV